MNRGLNGFVLEIERVLPASRPTVFAAVSDPTELPKWWGPEGFTVASLEFQARAGANYRIQMQPPEGAAFNITGRFQTVDAPDGLAFTFVYGEPDPDDVETLVDLSFRDVGQSTAVALTHGPFKTEARAGASPRRLDRQLQQARTALVLAGIVTTSRGSVATPSPSGR